MSWLADKHNLLYILEHIDDYDIADMFTACIRHLNLTIVAGLVRHVPSLDTARNRKRVHDVLYCICRSGDVCMIIYHLDIDNCGDMFAACCLYNNLVIAQMIYAIYPHIDVHHNDEAIFCHACRARSSNTVRWLLAVVSDIDVSIKEDFATRLSAAYYLDNTTRLLLQLCPGIDVHVHNEYIFRQYCKLGNKKMAQWLYAQYSTINVHALDDYAFNNCNSLSLVRWLCKIANNNNANYLVTDKCGYIVDDHQSSYDKWMCVNVENRYLHYQSYQKDVVRHYVATVD